MTIGAGLFHLVPYYQWRAPARIECFYDLEEDKAYLWRRSPEQSVDGYNPKDWLRPYLTYPVDGLVKGVAKELGRSTKSNIHFQALDAQ
jgi:hypothetical protein